MICRLFLSSIKTSTTINYGFMHNQKRNFRRLASTTTRSTPTADIPLPTAKISVTPGVNITPKRAPGPYALFLQEKMRDLVGKHKNNFKIGEMSKVVAAEWKKLNPDEKRRYENESERLQKEVEDAFVRMSSEEFREAVMQEMQRLQIKRVTMLRRQQKDLKEKFDYPDGDPDMFRLVSMAKDHVEELSNSGAARGKEMGKLWKELPENEKNAYTKREKEARSTYKKAIQDWEKKMRQQGLSGVVEKINLRLMKSMKARKASGYRMASKKVLGSKVGAKKKRSTGKRRTTRAKKA